MNQRKLNISRWSALGLAAVLLVAFLLLATGTAWARYRTEFDGFLKFKVREPVTVHLGQIDSETKAFTATSEIGWETVEGRTQLQFAVANGTTEKKFEKKDQLFRIRLISTLGVWSEDGAVPIQLIDPEQTGDEDEEAPEDGAETAGCEATAVRITKDSLLYNAMGDGWVYYFLDEKGQELTWTLEGGSLTCKELTLVIAPEAGVQINTTLIQLQAVAEITD